MPLLPELEPILDAMNSAPQVADPTLTVAQKRETADAAMDSMFVALADPPVESVTIEDRMVPVEGGEIVVRIYRPDVGTAGPLPAHVYVHGGGFWIGKAQQFDSGCSHIAAGAECVVVSVDYRLAPEHPYPIPLEDCYAATCWVADHSGELGIDVSRISIGGGSAGGNLTAAVALLARDRGRPALVAQVLEIPVTDLTMSQPSIEEFGKGYLLSKEAMSEYGGFYAKPEQHRDGYVSPLFAEDVSKLPPALVQTAEFDPLRDEGEAYAERLRAAAVPTQCTRWPGHIHGSFMMTKLLSTARDVRAEVIEFLKKAYSG